MLRRNLWTSKGLVNGALGVVKKIIFAENTRAPQDQPIAVMVEFANYFGPLIDGCVPIVPVTSSWVSNNQPMTRKQIPLIQADAINTHKCQGLTLDQAVVDLGDHEYSAGLFYVACSRVRTLNSLLFTRTYDGERFYSIGRLPSVKNE